jgi:hypothetical protein
MANLSDDPGFISDMKGLGAFSAEQLAEVVAITTNFLGNPTQADLMSDVASFGTKHKVSAKALRSTVRHLLLFFRDALKRNLSASQVGKELKTMGMDDAAAGVVSKGWGTSRRGLAGTMLGQTMRAHKLLDFQWKFGVTASTDECRQMSATYVQVLMVLDQGTAKPKEVRMEMDLPMFYELLAEFEKVKSLMDFLVD